MPSSKDRIAQEGGFTVAEIVVAAAILLIIVTASMTGLTFAAQSNQRTLQKSEATTLANQQIEYIRNLANFDDVASSISTGGLPAGKIASPRTVGEFTITTQVAYGAADPNLQYARVPYKDVTVVVSWDTSPPGSVTINTRVAGRDTQGLWNRGTMLLTVKDDATPAQPVAGVTVNLTDSASDSYSVVTTGAGTAVFTNVPAGTVTMSASMPGYLITNVPSSANCIANQVNDCGVATAKKLKSGVITVLAPSGVVIPSASVSLTGGGTSPAAQTTGADGKTTFASCLIGGNYTINVTPPTAWYTAVTSAGTLAIATADSTAVTVNLPASSVRAATIYVQSNTSGYVYVWNATGGAFPNSSSQLKVQLTGTSAPYKGTLTITNSDHLPVKYYFTKTTTFASTYSLPTVTAGTTYYSSSSRFVVN